jgi:hypothetical protein
MCYLFGPLINGRVVKWWSAGGKKLEKSPPVSLHHKSHMKSFRIEPEAHSEKPPENHLRAVAQLYGRNSIMAHSKTHRISCLNWTMETISWNSGSEPWTLHEHSPNWSHHPVSPTAAAPFPFQIKSRAPVNRSASYLATSQLSDDFMPKLKSAQEGKWPAAPSWDLHDINTILHLMSHWSYLIL